MSVTPQWTVTDAEKDWAGVKEMAAWYHDEIIPHLERALGEGLARPYLIAMFCARPEWQRATPELRRRLLWEFCDDDLALTLDDEEFEAYQTRMALVMLPEASRMVN